MHPLDQLVDGYHKPIARRAIDQRRIVGEVERAEPGQRREEFADPAELAEPLGPHDAYHSRPQYPLESSPPGLTQGSWDGRVKPGHDEERVRVN